MYLDHVNVIVIVCMYRIQFKLECLNYGLVYKNIVVYIYILISDRLHLTTLSLGVDNAWNPCA